MNLLSGRSFVVVMGVFACLTATGCFSCTYEHTSTPKVVVQPVPVVVAPVPVAVPPQ
jgi:hypothetical protein